MDDSAESLSEVRCYPPQKRHEAFRGVRPKEVCHKCAVRFEPIRAKVRLFNTGVKSASVWAFSRQIIEKNGERGRNRTFNLLIKSQLLCQLSYAPTHFSCLTNYHKSE